VIAKDIPPYSIAVGNPCQVVRKRFDDELIELLLEFRWWDKSIEEIESLMPILSYGDLEKVKMEIRARL
jgi:virginiamycin A acetyltransferase